MVIMKNIDTSETTDFDVTIQLAVVNPSDKIYFNIYSYDKIFLFRSQMYLMADDESITYFTNLKLSDFPDEHISALYFWNITDENENELEIMQPLILNR